MIGRCSGCPLLNFEDTAKGKVFLRCRNGGDDPRMQNPVIEITRKGNELRRAEQIPAPAWCRFEP